MEENIEKLHNFVDLQTSLLEEIQNLHLVIPYVSHPPPPTLSSSFISHAATHFSPSFRPPCHVGKVVIAQFPILPLTHVSHMVNEILAL